MPCISKQIELTPSIFVGNAYTTSFTAPDNGYYAVSLLLYIPQNEQLALFNATVLLNNQKIETISLTSSVPAYVKIGNVSAGSTITVNITAYGVTILGSLTITLGYVSDSEVCAYASDFNIPVLNNIKGAVCINPSAGYITAYNGCVEVTGVPCVDCAVSKRITLQGQMKTGENIITIQASGPLSSQVINALQSALKPGTTIDNETIESLTVQGNTVQIKVYVSAQQEYQAQVYTAIAIAIIIIAIAFAFTIIYVGIKQPQIVSAGFSAGLFVLLAGIGVGLGVAAYEYYKKKTS